jgi:hypothetical protein
MLFRRDCVSFAATVYRTDIYQTKPGEYLTSVGPCRRDENDQVGMDEIDASFRPQRAWTLGQWISTHSRNSTAGPTCWTSTRRLGASMRPGASGP